MKRIYITGRRFGKLIALQIDAANAKKQTKWLCICDCGQITSALLGNLTTGKTKSCGCNQHPGKHNQHGSKAYRVWGAMIQRCTNPNDWAYKYYGGRGISVCSSWKNFQNFYLDMGDPLPGLTLDRIDNDGNYYKDNCRWATRKEQRRNSRSTVLVEHDGHSLTLGEWAEKTNLSRDCIRGRLRRGWPAGKALGYE